MALTAEEIQALEVERTSLQAERQRLLTSPAGFSLHGQFVNEAVGQKIDQINARLRVIEAMLGERSPVEGYDLEV